MEANEIRIGNWVINNFDLSDYQQMNMYYFNKIQDNPNMFHPITLTEEWLIKFELLLDSKSDGIVKYSMIPFRDLTVVLQEDEQGRVEDKADHLCYVNYVHQLQNLYFALTGEELTIKEPAV